MADLDLPADLLPLHTAALRAERAMTEARLANGDVEAHPFWEERRQAGQHQGFWQASLDAAKKALDGEQS